MGTRLNGWQVACKLRGLFELAWNAGNLGSLEGILAWVSGVELRVQRPSEALNRAHSQIFCGREMVLKFS